MRSGASIRMLRPLSRPRSRPRYDIIVAHIRALANKDIQIMQSENRFFDDLAKLVNGAAGTVAGMSREFETNAREKAKQWIGGVDFVSREEFDALKALAAAAREEVELLKARIDALEGRSSEPVTKTVRSPKPKAGDAE